MGNIFISNVNMLSLKQSKLKHL